MKIEKRIQKKLDANNQIPNQAAQAENSCLIFINYYTPNNIFETTQ